MIYPCGYTYCRTKCYGCPYGTNSMALWKGKIEVYEDDNISDRSIYFINLDNLKDTVSLINITVV